MKKITVLFTVLLMLAASSAFAAVVAPFPAAFNGTLGTAQARENGTYLIYTGFSLNGTRGDSNNFALFGNNRTNDPILINGTSRNLNGTYTANNGSIATKAGFGNATLPAGFNFNDQFGTVTGLTSYGTNNASLNATTYYVPAGNYQLMVGFANASLNATGTIKSAQNNAYAGKALTMPIMYKNGTFIGIESTSNTWDYYAYGNNINYPVAVFGQVQITAASGNDNARAKFYVANATVDTDNTASWITYNATGLAKGSLALTNTKAAYRNLLENATVSADQNMITGWVNSPVGTDTRVFVVMIKGGTTLSSSDLSNRAFKLIQVGSGVTTKVLGNASASLQDIVYNESLVIKTGAAEVVTPVAGANGMTAKAVNLDNYTTKLATTTQFGIAQSNMTTYTTDGTTIAGAFYGKQSADKVFSVGFYESVVDGQTYFGLGFLIPSSAVAQQTVRAGNGYQNNATLALLDTNFTTNATAYTSTALKARWTGIASNFTPLTEVKGYSVTLPAGSRGDVYYTAQYKFTGVGGKVSNMRLYKVSPHSTSSWNLGYAGKATPNVDGSWWISTNTAGGYLNNNSILDTNTEYYLNWAIKDNGSYDANNTVALGIIDPVVFGSVPTSTSSSSSGCVFNPAAGFGLEWLLLMLAPLVAVVRSRFKK